MQQLSPMMQQYMEIKEQNKDCILLYRVGDFYEMFFDDAICASKVLELTLTGKSCGLEERAPMCGVPFHAVDTYIARLVNNGYKAAICEQVEDPATAKGLVKREVIQIVTPGTITSQTMLNEKENNYLCSIYIGEENTGIAYCDISTGELYGTQFKSGASYETLYNELVRIKAKEVIINDEAQSRIDIHDIKLITEAYFNFLEKTYYSREYSEKILQKQFSVNSLEGIGLGEKDDCIMAAGALFSYLTETQKQGLTHLNNLRIYEIGKQMSLDKSTIRNLEITETLYEKNVHGSLLGVLDKTHTAMGSRKMKQWLREPLNCVEEINERLDAVELLCDDIITRNNIKESLKRVYDLERLCGRIACGNVNAKDLIALRNSLFVLPEVKSDISELNCSLFERLTSDIKDLSEVYDMIADAICDDPPYTIKEGGVIKPGYSEELDSLKDSIKEAKQWILELEPTEKERTGIKSLKVSFNKVFGYYIEVTKSYLDMIPENYIRKQTLVNAERYITPELKEMEALVLNAETKINKLEYEIFSEIREKIQKRIPEIQTTAAAISAIDVLTSFASVAGEMNYVKPQVHNGSEIVIEKGRHPVIEKTIRDGVFVSNDTYLNNTDSSMLLITGPNMAGKSTYMRQTALIVLMAQAGSFVPCERASIGVVDRIFTRIGASDNLAQGQSTFYVEMSELAYILNTCSDRSLIILDEIGRGTSTYDGLSIAWAVAEHLCGQKKHVRTLFATHYHELTVLEKQLKGLRNLNVDVTDENGNVVFLHKIVPGSASRSYGIHVAKIAGVPSAILERAGEKLEDLESQDTTDGVSANITAPRTETSKTASTNNEQNEQISFFSFAPNPVVERLKALNLMDIKPSEAFKILEELKEAAK